jgi:hypothetical protein
MTDDRGVLGNLPHSRPGRRSEKRGTKVGDAAKPRATRSKPRPRPRPAAEKPPVREEATGSSGNPVGGLVRTASSLAGGGVRVARGVAGEVLRRLPRP